MCRHVAYLGPTVPLRSVLIDPPFGLYRQAWAPRRQRHGTVNADGFGVGWYAAGDPVPARYRRDVPIWGDPSLADLARVTRSGAVLAAVRSATPGMALGAAAVAPFAAGRWLFSHNGALAGWPGSAKQLSVPDEELLTLDALVDSALLWGLVLRRLRAGEPAEVALGATIRAAEAAGAPGAPGGAGRFNFLLTDGASVFATACGDTLWYRQAEAAVTVASEPSDDEPGWIEVPDRHVVTAAPSGVAVRPLTAVTEGITI